MKKILIFITILIMSLSLMIGCQSNEANKKDNKEPINNEVVNQDIDIKRVGKIALDKVNQLGIDDDEKRKWVIRVVLGAEASNQSLTDSEILKKATEMRYEQDKWFELAEMYGVKIPDSKVNEYIDGLYGQIIENKHINDYANSIGMDIEKFIYTFDFDRFKRDLTWLELRPILQKKYNTNDSKEIIKKYNEELKQ